MLEGRCKVALNIPLRSFISAPIPATPHSQALPASVSSTIINLTPDIVTPVP